ncbi:hypothetical protein ACFOW4_17175 [Micromonospora sp. GCM10011542]|uniref:hypothetical protein n=1 Tax=Micromonospora sp. GCM10011542 TaxID=3317337 RepID=UPI0036236FAC
MTERIRSLLDAAAAETRPRVVDPVSEVLRRGRASRRRHLATAGVASAVAVALLGTGGLVAANRTGAGMLAANPSPSTDTARTSPPLPSERPIKGAATPPDRPKVSVRVTDSDVRINGLILKVRSGWQVVQGDGGKPVTDCEIAPGSILVNANWAPGGDCDARAQIQVRPWQPQSYPLGAPTRFSEGVSEVILPGGQPAWLTDNDVRNFRAFKRSSWAAFNVNMPWAGAALTVETPTGELDTLLGSVSSEAVSPGRLVLPDSAQTAILAGAKQDRLDSTDAVAVAKVLKRLRGVDRVVNDGELPCASAQQLSPVWKAAGRDMATLTLTYPSGMPEAVIAISSTDACAFATSSMGGRVWLPAGFLAEVRALLAPGSGT